MILSSIGVQAFSTNPLESLFFFERLALAFSGLKGTPTPFLSPLFLL